MSRYYDALREADRLRLRNASRAVAMKDKAQSPVGPEEDSRGQREPVPMQPAETQALPFQEEPGGREPDAPQKGMGVGVHVSLDRKARIIPHAADSTVVEHYRKLRTKLLQEHETRPFRLLMVGSPNPQEGKTLTTFNLALSFAMLPSCRVLVVDGDLRKGSLGKWLAVDGRPGLSDLIEGTATLSEVLLKSDELPIHFIVRGKSKISAGELLNSPNLKDYFQNMAEQFDLVLVDSPPLNLITDAQLLAGCCDAILLIAKAFSTTRRSFEKAVQDLRQFRVLGTVLNGGTPALHYGRYNHYY